MREIRMRTPQMKSPRRFGATLVETSIVLGACLLFLFAIFEYGRFIMMVQLVENAAREGARQAVSGTDSPTTSNIQSTVNYYLAGQNLQSVSIQVYMMNPTTGANLGSWNNAAFGNTIAVQVTANYQPMLPTLVFTQFRAHQCYEHHV